MVAERTVVTSQTLGVTIKPDHKESPRRLVEDGRQHHVPRQESQLFNQPQQLLITHLLYIIKERHIQQSIVTTSTGARTNTDSYSSVIYCTSSRSVILINQS